MYNKKFFQKKYVTYVWKWICAHYLILFFSLGIFSLVYYISLSLTKNTYHWQWFRLWQYLGTWTQSGFTSGLILQGLTTTVCIAFLSFFFAIFFGLIASLLKLSIWPTGRLIAFLYIESIRNTPLLIQLFIVYFLLAPVIHLPPFYSAVLTLSLFEGAYIAEIFKSGLLAVPPRQWEAAYSMGLNTVTTVRLIIFPQAIPYIIPPLTGQLVSLIKDTSLVSAIAVADLTMSAQQIITTTFLPFEVWGFVGIIYLLLALIITIPAHYLEKYYKKKTYYSK